MNILKGKKTILTTVQANGNGQVPAEFLGSYFDLNFFIHRAILKTNANGSYEMSEKGWIITEFKTGVRVKSVMRKTTAWNELVELLNRHGKEKTFELLSKYEQINFDPKNELDLLSTPQPKKEQAVILGKYPCTSDFLGEADLMPLKAYKADLTRVKPFIKLANEIISFTGYTAAVQSDVIKGNDVNREDGSGKWVFTPKNIGNCIIVSWDKGSYTIPLNFEGKLNEHLLRAFGVQSIESDTNTHQSEQVQAVELKSAKVVSFEPAIIQEEKVTACGMTSGRASVNFEPPTGANIEVRSENKISSQGYTPTVKKNDFGNGFTYAIIKENYRELQFESVFFKDKNKYSKNKKYACIWKLVNKDHSEMITHIDYSNDLEELQDRVEGFPSWYNYPLGKTKNMQGYITDL